jgi:hypothetical protein
MTQIREKEIAQIKRVGRPPKRPTPSLPFQTILKIRDVMCEAANNAPDEIKLRRVMSFQDVIEELNEAVGRFFAIGYELADGIEIVKNLGLNLTDSEIKNILLQSQLRYESNTL